MKALTVSVFLCTFHTVCKERRLKAASRLPMAEGHVRLGTFGWAWVLLGGYVRLGASGACEQRRTSKQEPVNPTRHFLEGGEGINRGVGRYLGTRVGWWVVWGWCGCAVCLCIVAYQLFVVWCWCVLLTECQNHQKKIIPFSTLPSTNACFRS